MLITYFLNDEALGMKQAEDAQIQAVVSLYKNVKCPATFPS
jgi:hypothetical protein